jgi:tRNA-Thr(GGU) m(6)t(6)A37 methyltransferase TsaA
MENSKEVNIKLNLLKYIEKIEKTRIVFKPIGFVYFENAAQLNPEDIENTIVKIVIHPKLEQALYKIECYSHIIVLYYFHSIRKDKGRPLKVHIKGDPNLPEVGILASRAQNRPNPIGLKTVKLIDRKANILFVKGLDAFNGSPVIDIKPYIPKSDSISDALTLLDNIK